MLDLYLCLVVEVLNQAIWMVVLFPVKRRKGFEVGPVTIPLKAHVVTNPVKSKDHYYSWIFFYGERDKQVAKLAQTEFSPTYICYS